MNKKLSKAKDQHDKFLTDMGVHPSQLKTKKVKKTVLYRKGGATRIEDKVFLDDITAYQDTGRVKGIMANIDKELPHVQLKIRQLKSRVVPLYNKGGLQVMTESEEKNFDQVGHKTRRM
jgi:hypothetical protein